LVGFFSFVAVSRTGMIAYLIGKIGFIKYIPPSLFIAATVFIVPSVILIIYSSYNSLFLVDDVTTGTIRHLTYPAMAIQKVIQSPRYLFFGDGLRGGAGGFLDLDYSFLVYFINEMAGQSMKNFVVESVWTNIILGGGLFSLVFYLTWLCLGLRRNCKHLLVIIVVGGLFYTFDSSQFCFLVPFLMVISRKHPHCIRQ
jgi:hypothetical protein